MSEIIAILERNPKTEESITRVDRTEQGAADAKGRLSSTFQTSTQGNLLQRMLCRDVSVT
jgi:2-phospho-L-lactate guanylyltransferase (CobY/MobA/RfbA family)